MNLKFKNIYVNLVYIYLMMPVLIFFIGWTKWYIAIPCVLILVCCYFKTRTTMVISRKLDLDSVDKKKFIVIFAVIAFWVYLSGIGALVYQNSDHLWRNGIFNVLVENQWPVKGTVELDGILTDVNLVYYIGFWLPSAIVGKVFGLKAGYCAQAMWAVIGIFLFYYLVCIYLNKVHIWPLIVFIFFSGLDIIGFFVSRIDTSSWNGTLHLEWWSNSYQFSGFTTQLFWVFNQALPAWIITLLIMIQKKNNNIVLLLALSMLTSTLPFVGMIPFAILIIFENICDIEHSNNANKYKDRNWWKELCGDLFTFENVIGGGTVGILSFLYLKSNTAGNLLENSVQGVQIKGFLLTYIIFFMLEVGVYFIVTYKYYGKKILYYISLIWLAICPLVVVGEGKDFCMRASIPALVIVYLMTISTIIKAKESRDNKTLIAVICLLIIGSVTSKNEIQRTVVNTFERYNNNIDIIDEPSTLDDILKHKNFGGKVNDGLWYKYIVK